MGEELEEPPTTTTTTSPPNHNQAAIRSVKNLFDYTEEELYCSHSNNNSTHSSNTNNTNKTTLLFNHYELLQLPTHATSHEIKKAYRKLSLQYHPDKTGRDENDYGGCIYKCCVYG
jgi:DnaJ domain